MLKNLSNLSFFTIFIFIDSYSYAFEWNQNDLKFILGLDYSTGKYDLDESTEILYIPLEVKYRALPWQFSTTIPYIRITGPGGVVGGGGGGVIPVGDGSSSADSGQEGGGYGGGLVGGNGGGNCQRHSKSAGGHGNCNGPGHNGPGNGQGPGSGHGGGNSDNVKIFTEQGLGDILLEANYALDMVKELPFYADLGAILKVPTADKDKGLGTGEFDFALQLDVSKVFYSINQIETTPFAIIRYRFMGDPEEIDFNNVWYTSVGVDLKFGTSTHVGASYDYRQAITSSSSNVSEALVYYDYTFNKNWSLSAYGALGFADGSPDQAVGLLLKYIPDE